jgi:hypothetical protein
MRLAEITYGIREEVYCLGEERRCAFGIVAYSDAEEDGTATVVAAVGDVTSDRVALMELVKRCNDGGLDPIHLHDVTEDFIG